MYYNLLLSLLLFSSSLLSLVVTFLLPDINNYIPETWICRVAGILWLQLMVYVSLFTGINDLCCCVNIVLYMFAVPNIFSVVP